MRPGMGRPPERRFALTRMSLVSRDRSRASLRSFWSVSESQWPCSSHGVGGEEAASHDSHARPRNGYGPVSVGFADRPVPARTRLTRYVVRANTGAVAPRAQSADREVRCGWAPADPLMMEYHDRDWGGPGDHDRRMFGV